MYKRMTENQIINFYEEWKSEVDKEIEKLKMKKEGLIIKQEKFFYKNRIYENDVKLKEYYKEEIGKNEKSSKNIDEEIEQTKTEIEKLSKLSSRLDYEINN